MPSRHPCPHPRCNKFFSSVSSARLHVRFIHNNEDVDRFVCDLCLHSCRSRITLELHKLVHQTAKPFACEECNRKFKTEDFREKHHKSMHLGEKSVQYYRNAVLGVVFKCDVCDREYRSRGAVVLHKKNKHSNMVGQPTRPFDYKYFATASGDTPTTLITRVEQTELLKTTVDKWPLVCQFEHNSVDALSLDVAVVPACEIEEAVGRMGQGSEVHRLTHSDEKSFNCVDCDFASKSELNFRQHITNYHSLTKQCPRCGNHCATALYRSHYLHEHKKTHVKWVKCGIDRCRSIIGLNNRRAHAKAKHGRRFLASNEEVANFVYLCSVPMPC